MMRARLHTPRARGFTLIELLVAITILAIVAVLGWRGLDGIVRSRTRLSAQMEQTRGQQLAFAQLQNDLEHLAPAVQLHNRQNMAATNGGLTLVRTVLAENDASRVQVVSYRVKDGVLLRRESTATRDLAQLDGLWQAALNDTDTAAAVALQSDVAGITIRIWQNGAWNAASGSSGSSGSTSTSAPASSTPAPLIPAALLPNAAPTGLEFSLQLQDQQVPLVKVFLMGAV